MPKNTNTTYKCEICDEGHSKKSVNDCHLKSEKHLKNCEIFRLKLNTKEMDVILIDYPELLNINLLLKLKLRKLKKLIRWSVKNTKKQIY